MVPARELWNAILTSQIETGIPYMLYKDSCNSKSNQKNLGTIKCSNLCTEIMEFTSKEEVAVCNLASVVLPKFVQIEPSIENRTSNGAPSLSSTLTNQDSFCDYFYTNITHNNSISYQIGVFNHTELYYIVKQMVRNLNKIIDINYYPVQEANNSNTRHRPIGLGVQGLADVFQLLHLPFDSLDSRALNKNIFETIYFAAVDASCELAEREGKYESFEGSPASQGLLQFDLWNVTPSARWNWVYSSSSLFLFSLCLSFSPCLCFLLLTVVSLFCLVIIFSLFLYLSFGFIFFNTECILERAKEEDPSVWFAEQFTCCSDAHSVYCPNTWQQRML